MRSTEPGAAHELLVTSVPERFNEIAEILFGERVPEVREINLKD